MEGTTNTESTTTNRPRSWIYCRVSSRKQEEDGTSLDTQETRCREYVAAQGWEVARVLREVHTGADLFERTELTKLREAVKRGEVDVVLAYAVDRLSREQIHLGLLLSEFEYHDVIVDFVTEKLDDTPEGSLLQAVRGYTAQIERLKIAERTQRGMKARIDAGKPVGKGEPPYGLRWRFEPKGKGKLSKVGYEPDPATIPVVRRIFADYAAGHSVRGIAKRLDADGIFPPRYERTGKRYWHYSTVKKILRERVYIGEAAALRWQKPKIRGRVSQSSRKRPADEWVALPDGVAPKIIDPELFELVQRRLATAQRESQRTDRDPNVGILRRGFVVCGGCGHKMFVTYTRGVPHYVCQSDGKKMWGCPKRVSIKVEDLDGPAWWWVWDVISRVGGAARYGLGRRAEPGIAPGELDRAERVITDLNARIETLIANLALVTGSAAERVVAEIERLQGELERATAERDRLAAMASRQRILSVVTAENAVAAAGLAAIRAMKAAEPDPDPASIHRIELPMPTGQFAIVDVPVTWKAQRAALDTLNVRVEVNAVDSDKPRWMGRMVLPLTGEELCGTWPGSDDTRTRAEAIMAHLSTISCKLPTPTPTTSKRR